MKQKLWLFQLPIVLICTLSVLILGQGLDGRLENRFLHENIFPSLLNISNVFSDLEFHLRGAQKPATKNIVIIDIDDTSVQAIGRWPWHRDVMAELIEKAFLGGAKIVGLDMVFSEPDVRVSDDMQKKLEHLGYGYLRAQVETDPLLAQAISNHAHDLIMGWTPLGSCRPATDLPEQCPLIEHSREIEYPSDFAKFSLHSQTPDFITPEKSPLISSFDTLANLQIFTAVALNSGFFQALPDPDGVIRRAPLIEMVNGKAYPSLTLEMASLIQHENLNAEFDHDFRLKTLMYLNSKVKIPTNSLGFIEFNSRGPGHTFPYVSALDIFSIGEKVEGAQIVASQRAAELMKGAYVFIGVSALGASDLRSFTFDKIVPGVEGHATILDNLLAGDFIIRDSGLWTGLLVLIGGLFFAYYSRRLESIPALLVAGGILLPLSFFDYKFLFLNHRQWNLDFFYIEIITIYGLTTIAKYILEERDKKFIKGAFSRYVSPDLVNSIIKDPGKLSLGGEKKNLTILFSDIRGFTSFSEKIDAKTLSSFLNEYLGTMTKVIFTQQGTLDKYIGDAIMAFWGAPLNISQHASLACQAAIEMIGALNKSSREYQDRYGIEVKIGIGVNTGPVSVGNMGSDTNFSYTVIGDHVNLASRLESLTKFYGVSILTTRFTFDAIRSEGRELPPHRILDLVKVKGKSQAVELIQLLSEEISRSALESFEKARHTYRQQQWSEAIKLFQQTNLLIHKQSGKDDGPCQVYTERCNHFKGAPPGTSWDGSWEMKNK